MIQKKFYMYISLFFQALKFPASTNRPLIIYTRKISAYWLWSPVMKSRAQHLQNLYLNVGILFWEDENLDFYQTAEKRIWLNYNPNWRNNLEAFPFMSRIPDRLLTLSHSKLKFEKRAIYGSHTVCIKS